MRSLGRVTPTGEQLGILSNFSPGAMLIRGAAGSGKTTTAILRLRSLITAFESRRMREESAEPIRALVLTFNKTLRGYIEELVASEVEPFATTEIEVATFAQWAIRRLGNPSVIQKADRIALLRSCAANVPLDVNFAVGEAEYAMGRFLPSELSEYLACRRHGRGTTPRVDTPVRKLIIGRVIEPYQAHKLDSRQNDFNDLAVNLAIQQRGPLYDIVIADECQDFSGNEMRAVVNHVADDHSLTLIIDSVQRIYARGFTWPEVGLRRPTIRPLKVNYRNTVEIAKFAAPLVAGVPLDEDGTLPDFTKSHRHGELPVVLEGKFSAQMAWALNRIRSIDLEEHSVAFLHPGGGHWFDHVRRNLRHAELEFVELSTRSEWPQSAVNIGLSTIHSAKGLEFDYVFILGANEETLRNVEGDDDKDEIRRLLAMGIGRAKDFVCLGYRADDRPDVMRHLDATTYERIRV